MGARPVSLPPCSPDVTPIGFAFARLKSLVRAAARTGDAFRTSVGPILDAVTPGACRNLFTAAGHEPDRAQIAPA